MFYKPTIFGTPSLTGGLAGDPNTEGCCHGSNVGGQCVDASFTPPPPPGCSWGVHITQAVVGGLTAAGGGALAAKGLFPGPADAG